MDPFQVIPDPSTDVTRVIGVGGLAVGWISSRFLNMYTPVITNQQHDSFGEMNY
jgi:hypothetical protein